MLPRLSNVEITSLLIMNVFVVQMSLPIIVKNTWTMATTIEQQVALDEALVPSTQRCLFFKAFLVTADVPEIYMQEFWAIAYVHQRSIRFKMNNKKHIVDLESFREMLHICPRIPRSVHPRRNKINWHYVRDDSIFSTIKVVSRHQNTQQYGAMLPIELTNDEIRNTKAYKEYYAFAIGDSIFSTIKVVSRHQNTQQYGAMLPIELTNDEIRNTKAYKEYYAFAIGKAAPKPKASARRKRSGLNTTITPPTATTTLTTTVAVTPRLTAAVKGKQPAKSKSPSDPSELGGSGIDEGTGSKPGVLDVPTDESEEELSWNSFDDEGVDDQEKVSDDDEGDEGDGEEDQGLRISEEERLNKEEEAKELYRDVNINQGRGIQATLDVEDSHVTLTPVHPDGQQDCSSVSSHFVTSMLNLPSDAGMESIFATASSSVAPLQTSTPIMTPSTIATITTISHAPIPPTTIPSEVLQNLPTFDSVFHFEDRLKSLEAKFSEYIQTNPFVEVVSNILGIVHQYMNQ
nr:hypothetical protein [Tanacetum cinerariifolium]